MGQTARVILPKVALAALLLVGGGTAILSGAARAWVGALRRDISISRTAPGAPVPTVGSLPVGATPGQFTTEQFTGADGQQMTYYLYVPASYSPSVRYPLVLLLHGGGERSQANKTAAQNRALLLGQQYVQDWVAPEVQHTWPSFVLVPQVAGSARWVTVPASQGSYVMQRQPATSLQLAVDMVVTLQQAYPGIDANRVYVTGLSMGGYGAWEAAERWPGVFAASVPLAGAGDLTQAYRLAQLPVWAFHGSADTVVPVSGSRQMVAAIRAAGGSPCYTEYGDKDHGIWNSERVYANPDLLRWLFSQTKASGSGTTAARPLACPAP